MDINCNINDVELQRIDRIVHNLNINVYSIYESIMSHINEVIQHLRRYIPIHIINIKQAEKARVMNDLVNNPNSNERNILINKLLAIKLYIHIPRDVAPGVGYPPLQRQDAGLQTEADYYKRYAIIIFDSYNINDPYASNWQGNEIIPRKYIRYAEFWIQRHFCLKDK